MKALKLKAPVPTEDDEAECLIQWASVARFGRFRLSQILIMVPNGAYLGGDPRQRAITMAKLKRMGFRNGIADYLLPVARGSHHGLAIELKRRSGGIVSGPQAQFKADMEALGWKCVICEGFEAAKSEIEHYLEQK